MLALRVGSFRAPAQLGIRLRHARTLILHEPIRALRRTVPAALGHCAGETDSWVECFIVLAPLCARLSVPLSGTGH